MTFLVWMPNFQVTFFYHVALKSLQFIHRHGNLLKFLTIIEPKLMYRTRATITCSWILTIHKAKDHSTWINFKKWIKRIQTAGYNGVRGVIFFVKPERKSKKTDSVVWLAAALMQVFSSLPVLCTPMFSQSAQIL